MVRRRDEVVLAEVLTEYRPRQDRVGDAEARDGHGMPGRADPSTTDSRTAGRSAGELDSDVEVSVQAGWQRNAADERGRRTDEECVLGHDLAVRADPSPRVVAFGFGSRGKRRRDGTRSHSTEGNSNCGPRSRFSLTPASRAARTENASPS